MQKKDDKVGNNTGYKKERQREKRKIECALKQKAASLHPISWKICPC